MKAFARRYATEESLANTSLRRGSRWACSSTSQVGAGQDVQTDAGRGPGGDAPRFTEVLARIRVVRPGGGHPRTRPGHVSGDKAYGSRRNRGHLRRCQIKHTIPEPKDQRANRKRRGSKGGQPIGFDSELYKRRNEVERTIDRLKHHRAVATRYDKRAYIFHGTITTAAIRLRLRLRLRR